MDRHMSVIEHHSHIYSASVLCNSYISSLISYMCLLLPQPLTSMSNPVTLSFAMLSRACSMA